MSTLELTLAGLLAAQSVAWLIVGYLDHGRGQR
jgi:hypothetical protein